MTINNFSRRSPDDLRRTASPAIDEARCGGDASHSAEEEERSVRSHGHPTCSWRSKTISTGDAEFNSLENIIFSFMKIVEDGDHESLGNLTPSTVSRGQLAKGGSSGGLGSKKLKGRPRTPDFTTDTVMPEAQFVYTFHFFFLCLRRIGRT